MWLNQLFIENPIDFEKRCRNRIVYGICFILLGAAAIGLSFAVRNHAMVMYLEQGYKDFMPGFYSGTGFGLAAAGVISIMRNLKYLRNPELKEKRRIYETDERNRMLGLRCWAYTGYTMMISLYIGILISGVHQHDRDKDPDIRSRIFCGAPAGVQKAFAEGYVGTYQLEVLGKGIIRQMKTQEPTHNKNAAIGDNVRRFRRYGDFFNL